MRKLASIDRDQEISLKVHNVITNQEEIVDQDEVEQFVEAQRQLIENEMIMAAEAFKHDGIDEQNVALIVDAVHTTGKLIADKMQNHDPDNPYEAQIEIDNALLDITHWTGQHFSSNVMSQQENY